jgi:hypothetical protein
MLNMHMLTLYFIDVLSLPTLGIFYSMSITQAIHESRWQPRLVTGELVYPASQNTLAEVAFSPVQLR